MSIRTIVVAVVLAVMIASGAYAVMPPGVQGGGTPVSPCLSDKERILIHSLPARRLGPLAAGVVSLSDPVGNGGTNAPGQPLSNYVDLDPGSGVLDWNCGSVTYDTHNGVDVEIDDFYAMDEGVAALCAAPGVVSLTNDGGHDRHLDIDPGAITNYVIVDHADGTQTFYWHLRQNSVAVSVGDTVQTGDTLGFIGSSGFSTWPHLHFGTENGGTVLEPNSGPCQSTPSLWAAQQPYVFDLPFEPIQSGITTLPTSPVLMSERPPSTHHVVDGDTVYFWIRARSVIAGTMLRWNYYHNDTLWTWTGFPPSESYATSWWLSYQALPTGPAWWGDWRIEFLYDDSLIAQHSFTYDGTPKTPPLALDSIFPDLSPNGISGEFAGSDSEGDIFWYVVSSGPSHGTLEQFGGRKRKFRYIPDSGFTGADTVTYHAIDCDSVAGSDARYVFDVSTDCDCPHQGDMNTDNTHDSVDLNLLISVLFLNGVDIQDPSCPRTRSDVTCDGQSDSVDLNVLIGYLFLNGAPPCDPCAD